MCRRYPLLALDDQGRSRHRVDELVATHGIGDGKTLRWACRENHRPQLAVVDLRASPPGRGRFAKRELGEDPDDLSPRPSTAAFIASRSTPLAPPEMTSESRLHGGPAPPRERFCEPPSLTARDPDYPRERCAREGRPSPNTYSRGWRGSAPGAPFITNGKCSLSPLRKLQGRSGGRHRGANAKDVAAVRRVPIRLCHRLVDLPPSSLTSRPGRRPRKSTEIGNTFDDGPRTQPP